LPYNFVLLRDEGYRRDVEALLERCAESGVAVQTIKSVARRRWIDEDAGPRFSWYKPTEDEAALGRAVRYVLSHEQLFLNTSSDARLLRPILTAAASRTAFGSPTDVELADDAERLGMQPLFDGGALERI
jgi:hypothetical protein